jgi:hypothetical protein
MPADMPTGGSFAVRRVHGRVSRRARRLFGRSSAESVQLMLVLEQVAHWVKTVAIRLEGVSIPRRLFRLRLIERGPIDFSQHMNELTDSLFRRLYRLEIQDFTFLIGLLDPDLRRTHSRPYGVASSASPSVMLAVTLRYLAGAKVLDLGWPYGLSDSTVYALIDETL